MPVDMKDVGLMLVRASRDQEVGDRHAVLAVRCEFALGGARDGDRLGVRAELVEGIERRFEPLEVARRTRTVEKLESRDRAEAGLAERGIDRQAADQGRLVEKDPARRRGAGQLQA